MPGTTKFEDRPRSYTRYTSTRTPVGGISNSVTTGSEGTNREVYTYRSWVNTPGYRAKRLSGAVLPVNSYTYEGWKASGGGGWAKRTDNYSDGTVTTVTFTLSSQGYAYVVANGNFDSTLPGKAKLRALSRARGTQWNVPVFLAELSETSGMVKMAATRIVMMALALKRGDVKTFIANAHASWVPPSVRKVKTFQKAFGRNPKDTYLNYWLEWRYGWSPFIDDVFNAVETLQDIAELPQSHVGTVRGSAKSSSFSNVSTTIFSREGGSIKVTGDLLTRTKTSARITWRMVPKAGSIPARLGLTNPALVAWEIVPLSFVADWFLPIGSYLESLDTNLRFTTVDCSLGQRVEVTVASMPYMASKGVTFAGLSSVCQYVKVSRSALLGSPIPSITELSFTVPDTVSQAISAIALLNQRIR